MFLIFKEVVIEIISIIGVIIDIFGVVIIIAGISGTCWLFFTRRVSGTAIRQQEYRTNKVRIGRALIIGREILVAADIIKTVVIEATFENVGDPGFSNFDADHFKLDLDIRN